ncbi:hypothetical protein [Nakamurella lactea]|uniref:hypothetical protein n=1 Tax=Nakamurella lactea TaxID=459515 RepID=UPI0004146EC6|nr:hypothetical protein [Nakamurella lactea]
MITPLAMTLLGIGLLLAAWTGLQAYRRRPANAPQIVTAIALTAALAVQSVIGWFRMTADIPHDRVTFIAYSIGILLPLPLGIWVARLERTRWGSIALCFTAVVVAVMTLRLHQLWQAGS